MNQLGLVAGTVGQSTRTRYPRFFFGLPLGRGTVPVFRYHDVTAAELSADLEFLAHNQYRTVSLEEFTRAQRGQRLPARSVLLTFDGGRKSFWHVAMPLLRTFGARATVFAPTYWMSASPRHPADDQFMSWTQLRTCLNTGLVDVQSRAHRHALVFVSKRLEGFATPSMRAKSDVHDWPMRGVDEIEELGRPELGTPLYRAAPLLSASRHYLENGTVARVCCDYVRDRGPELFAHPEWQKALRKIHAKHSRRHRGRQATSPELFALLQSEFERSRDAFCQHLGYPPTYIAFPWMVGSKLSIELARLAGIRGAFGVALSHRDARRGRQLPFPVFDRLHSEWLRFLPGRRRASVFGALYRRMIHVAVAQNPAPGNP